jgi:hypothetical protein
VKKTDLKNFVAVRMDDEMYETVTRYAKEYELQRPAVVRQCVAKCLGVKEDLKRIKFETQDL